MARHWILVPGIGVRIPEGQPQKKVPVRFYARAFFCAFPFLATKGEIEMAFFEMLPHVEEKNKGLRVKTHNPLFVLVGAKGFEPPAPCSQSRCSTGLSHAPFLMAKSIGFERECQ